jgi:U32 family peptidase
MKRIGKVTRFFDKIMVAVIKLEEDLNIGDEITIKGENTDFSQKIESMEINRQKINFAKSEDEIAIKVDKKTKINDILYKN